MKVTVAAAMSVDGKLTRHDEDKLDTWVSDEDQVHFKALIKKYDSIVLGRNVYELSKGHLELKPGKLRIVLTSTPDKYAHDEVKGQLEFRNEPPSKTIEYLQSLNKQSLLITGGERMIGEFLEAGCVDEIYLTIEPRIFGQGVRLVAPTQLDVKLELVEHSQLNKRGTMLLLYKVV